MERALIKNWKGTAVLSALLILFFVFLLLPFTVKAEAENGLVPAGPNSAEYYKGDTLDTTFTGFAQHKDVESYPGWFYVVKGKVDFKYNGLVYGTIDGKTEWWYVKDSKFEELYNGVVQNDYGWWAVHSGKVDFSYNGFEVNDYGWWYLENGKVNFNVNDIIYGYTHTDPTLPGYFGWWYVKDSKVTKITTVAPNSNGWWYVKDGIVDFDFTGCANNANGWWAIRNGKVDFSYNGFTVNENGWWYAQNGKVNFNVNDIISGKANTEASLPAEDGWWYVRGSRVTKATTVAPNSYGWWFVEDGKVNFSHDGVEKNENGWWAIRKGKVDFNYKGFLPNAYGWWYLQNGQVSFKVNDILLGKANTDPSLPGEDGWWNVRGSKVQPDTTVAQNSLGWWFVDKGKVDFSFNGLAQNSSGWWHIKNGKVDFNSNSVVQHEGEWYCVKNGRVRFDFTGLADNEHGWWYIKNGKVDFTYTGPAFYGGYWFHVINGKIHWDFSGTHDEYTVEKGRIMSGYINVGGKKIYIQDGKLATDSVMIDGKPEVFRIDGTWIDTSAMDAKAASYSSSTNYLILVSLKDRVTKIYQKSGGSWVPIKAILCTVGDTSRGMATVTGDFYVGYSSWGNNITRGYSFEDTEGHTLYYWTRFCDAYLFHSILYDRNTFNESPYGNALGEELSHGCVRMRIENAKWIYDNIPDNTRVIVY